MTEPKSQWQIRAEEAEHTLNQIDDLFEYRARAVPFEELRSRVYVKLHEYSKRLKRRLAEQGDE